MKRFVLVLLIVLSAIFILAACAPVQEGVESYARVLPGWVIIVGAVVIFLIGFGIIWKLIPGFIKVLAIIALAVILAGTAYGVWHNAWAEDAIQGVEDIRDDYFNETPTPGIMPDEPL